MRDIKTCILIYCMELYKHFYYTKRHRNPYYYKQGLLCTKHKKLRHKIICYSLLHPACLL